MIRLDKYISATLIISRRDAAEAIRKGRISVDGRIVKTVDYKMDPDKSVVMYDGQVISYSEYIYIMLNKPEGLICASRDAKDNTIMCLFPKEYIDKGIASVGRLDKDTTGLLLITNDGVLAHKLLSPKKQIKKKYYVTCDKPFSEEDKEVMRKGIIIEGKRTAPAILELVPERPECAYVTLTEGKFHEVKRLCYACCEKEVLALERVEFAGLFLDTDLEKGKWRMLEKKEVESLKEL